MLAAVVEEARVVSLSFERANLGLDERVDLLDDRGDLARHGIDVGGQLLCHGSSLLAISVWRT